MTENISNNYTIYTPRVIFQYYFAQLTVREDIGNRMPLPTIWALVLDDSIVISLTRQRNERNQLIKINYLYNN